MASASTWSIVISVDCVWDDMERISVLKPVRAACFLGGHDDDAVVGSLARGQIEAVPGCMGRRGAWSGARLVVVQGCCASFAAMGFARLGGNGRRRLFY